MRVFKKCNSFLSKSLATHKYIKTNCNTFFTVLNHTQIKLRRYCREQVGRWGQGVGAADDGSQQDRGGGGGAGEKNVQKQYAQGSNIRKKFIY